MGSPAHARVSTTALCPGDGLSKADPPISPFPTYITRYDGELREPLVWRQGSQGFMSVAEGACHCPRVMVGESGLKMR